MSELQQSLLELIRRTSAEIPDDVNQSILASLEREKKGTIAESALKIIDQNIQLAKRKSQPICQDTGSILFYVDCPVGFDQITFEETAKEAVKLPIGFPLSSRASMLLVPRYWTDAPSPAELESLPSSTPKGTTRPACS